MADLDDLRTAKSSAIARLKDVLAAPKPTYSIDGQTVAWTDYARQLREQIAGLNDLIQAEEGPSEEETVFIT